jgi:Fe-S oxidoreductase
LTCGFASGIRNGYDMRQVEIEAKKKLDQILDTGLGEVSVNCPGCWAGIIGAVKLANEDLKVRFAISEILWAFGDDPPKSTKKR